MSTDASIFSQEHRPLVADELRWSLAMANRVSEESGKDKILSVHWLQAICRHPRASQLFRQWNKAVLEERTASQADEVLARVPLYLAVDIAKSEGADEVRFEHALRAMLAVDGCGAAVVLSALRPSSS